MSIRFQFLKGAIKSLTCLTIHGNNTVFQFLKGAIKRLNTWGVLEVVFKFQFLKGAIKRTVLRAKVSIVEIISIP